MTALGLTPLLFSLLFNVAPISLTDPSPHYHISAPISLALLEKLLTAETNRSVAAVLE